MFGASPRDLGVVGGSVHVAAVSGFALINDQ